MHILTSTKHLKKPKHPKPNMKTIFIDAKANKKISIDKKYMKKLPGSIGLFTTIQFHSQINAIKKSLEEQRIKVKLFKTSHTYNKGQLLGCNVEKFPGVDAFLYIGDGEFHPLALSVKNKKPVFIYNPFSDKMKKIEDFDKFSRQKNAALKKFYMSENIGIIVSTKPGQNRLKSAMSLSKRVRQKLNKKTYILVANDIDIESLENYPFIDCFINTACPRISYDEHFKFPKPVLELNDVICAMEE